LEQVVARVQPATIPARQPAQPTKAPPAEVQPAAAQSTATRPIETRPAEATPSSDSQHDDTKVSFVFTKDDKNPLFILDALQETRIVPKHVIEPLFKKLGQDQSEFLKLKFDQSPVVSGPYNLHSYSSEKIALERRDDYWGNAAHHGGKKPAPRYVVHPIYKSTDHYSVALQQGRLDFSSNFVPRIWLKARKGVRAWFDEAPYFVSNSMP